MKRRVFSSLTNGIHTRNESMLRRKKREKRENSNLPVKKATTAQRKKWGFGVNDGLSRQKEEGRLEIYGGGGER